MRNMIINKSRIIFHGVLLSLVITSASYGQMADRPYRPSDAELNAPRDTLVNGRVATMSQHAARLRITELYNSGRLTDPAVRREYQELLKRSGQMNDQILNEAVLLRAEKATKPNNINPVITDPVSSVDSAGKMKVRINTADPYFSNVKSDYNLQIALMSKTSEVGSDYHALLKNTLLNGADANDKLKLYLTKVIVPAIKSESSANSYRLTVDAVNRMSQSSRITTLSNILNGQRWSDRQLLEHINKTTEFLDTYDMAKSDKSKNLDGTYKSIEERFDTAASKVNHSKTDQVQFKKITQAVKKLSSGKLPKTGLPLFAMTFVAGRAYSHDSLKENDHRQEINTKSVDGSNWAESIEVTAQK